MALSKDYHPNGVRKTRKVPRSDAGFRPASGYVAAIDFGTTYCSVAYTLQGSEEIFKLPLDGPLKRVPNAILIERKGHNVTAFGYRAQHKFAILPKEDRKRYIYFERMKMILYRTQDVNRDMPVSPISSNEQYYLVDVVGFILKYLKDQLYDALDFDMSQVQFDWVVTVPAIWDVRGKQMMREAAYKAGLCSSPPSCELIPYNRTRKSNMPVEDAPDRLSLALEPEAAGLFCQNSGEHHYKPRHFTVLDFGGGTVDITSYRIDQYGHICVVDKASGNDWGGTRVNEKFAQFLESIVNDPGFTQYISVPDPQLQQQHKADLNKLIYGSFEQQKMIFGDEEDDDERIPAVINIPNSFIKFYRLKEINSRYSAVVDLDGNELTVESQKMKEFFEDAINHICRYAFLALERVKSEVYKVEAVYLVGGFGGCKFIRKVVQERLQDQFGAELDVFVPIEHKLAIACGAIIFRRNPEVIWSRKAEATYGDIVISPFEASIHDPAYKIIDEDGKYYCHDLFRPYTEIGDTICADEVLQNSIIPFKSNQTYLDFTIYSSDRRNIWYAKDTAGKLVSELKYIGKLVFDLKGIPEKSKYDKRVILTIDLSQTEIQLKAHHEKTGIEVKVVLDTL